MSESVRALRQLLRSLGMETLAAEQLLAQMLPAQPGDEDEPLYTVSVAAQLAGMHPQTLRQYDRLGLVIPERTKGRGRRYSRTDVDRLLQVQRLSHEGVSLAGIAQIMQLERENQQLRREARTLRRALSVLAQQKTRVFAADSNGSLTPYQRGSRPLPPRGGRQLIPRGSYSSALVLWRR